MRLHAFRRMVHAHLFVGALGLSGSWGCEGTQAGGGSGGGSGGAGGSDAAAGGTSSSTTEGGGSGSGGEDGTLCEFTVSKNQLSTKIPTVGVVEWSLAGSSPSSAQIVYRLNDAASTILNRGGQAPVDLGKANYRTLLLGLKQAADYTFHIEASRDGQACVSPDYVLPRTGSFTEAQSVGVTVTRADEREPGFIVTSSGMSLPSSASIIDADGAIVWYVDGPQSPTRAQLDYEGENLWMLALNLTNQGGEMRYVSMDGEVEQHDVPGLENTHHDFTVMPGGRVAALAWRAPGVDTESDLVIRSPDGTLTTAFGVGENLYLSDSYHANAVHYLPFDDSFTISDRNPNVFVKVSATGSVQWQLGGVCDDAPAGNNCSPQDWQVNHGHQLFEDGTFVLFNNGIFNDGTLAPAHVFEFTLNIKPSSFSATLVKDYEGAYTSSNLGDVQRLPGGNTLVTYAGDGKIVELDASWDEVQTFSVRAGYSNWRPTLYGPPLRL